MKRSSFTKEQIAHVLRRAEVGVPVAEAEITDTDEWLGGWPFRSLALSK
jgi:hypothetical protein